MVIFLVHNCTTPRTKLVFCSLPCKDFFPLNYLLHFTVDFHGSDKSSYNKVGVDTSIQEQYSMLPPEALCNWALSFAIRKR